MTHKRYFFKVIHIPQTHQYAKQRLLQLRATLQTKHLFLQYYFTSRDSHILHQRFPSSLISATHRIDAGPVYNSGQSTRSHVGWYINLRTLHALLVWMGDGVEYAVQNGSHYGSQHGASPIYLFTTKQYSCTPKCSAIALTRTLLLTIYYLQFHTANKKYLNWHTQ